MHAQQAGDVDLKARVGFDGYCKENQWLPIHVEVENTGSDLNAEVQVSYKKSAGGLSSVSMNVELPATSRKEFFLYIYFPQEYAQQWNVILLANRKVLKKVNLAVNCISADNTIFGVLADTPSTYDALNDIKPINGFVRLAQLTTSDLPDRAQAWAALDALIVSNVDTGTLTSQQKQALEAWVAAGGKLLTIGGTNWQSTTAGLKDLLPVRLDTTRHVGSLSQLQEYVKDPTSLDAEAILATGQLQRGAQVLVQQDGIPLIVQKTVGFGSVYFVAADPALQPLTNWSGMQAVYEHLLGSKSQLPTWAKGTWYDNYRANQALATIPELGLPSILYICGLLGFYIVIIGPLNYIVLRRLKRREFAWVTIPAIVIIFTCLAYGTGFSYRGVTPILNRLAVAQAWEGTDQAKVRALVGIYSPIRTKYDLEAGDGFMLQPFGNNDTNLQASNNWTSLQDDTNMTLPDVSMEIGAMKSVVAEGSLPALEFDHNLVVTVSILNPVLSGSITNKSHYTLKDAFLVTSGDWTRLGTLAPGETKRVDLSLAAGANGPNFYSLGAANILNLSYPATQTDEDAARRSAFLDTILLTNYGFNSGNWGVYLIGWVDGIEVPVRVKDRKSETIDTLLYIDELSPSLKIELGDVHWPASLFTWESSAPNTSPYYVREVPQNGYTLRFQPAFPLSPANVKSIELYLTTNAAYQDLTASAWDYEQKAWVQVPLTGSYTSFPEAERYVGPDGEIRIKIMNKRSDWTEITASNLLVTVKP